METCKKCMRGDSSRKHVFEVNRICEVRIKVDNEKAVIAGSNI